MPFCNRIDEVLASLVLLETLLDFSVRGACALEIALVHDYDVGQIEHNDLLQLQPAAVIRIHHQHGRIDNSVFLKRHRLLTGAHRLDDDVIEIRLAPASARQSCVAGESPPACPRVAMLRMNTRSSCELIMVARSPSSAPSPTTLGSWDKIAIRPFGFWLRNRRTSSSISVVLPAPPGPVKPITFDVRCSMFDACRAVARRRRVRCFLVLPLHPRSS